MEFVKPVEWGSRFQFPENQQLNFDGLQMSVTDKIVAQMVDNYETAVVAEIAQAARIAGASDVTVLNKAAIIDALMKQRPEKVKDGTCPRCHRIFLFRFGEVSAGSYCNNCGQALDWEVENK